MAGKARAAVDQRHDAKPRLIGKIRLRARRFRLCGASDRAVGRHRAVIGIDCDLRRSEGRRRNLELAAQKRGDPQIAFEIFGVDAQGAGGIGETDVVYADMRLRQHHENGVALRNGDEPGGLPDLRKDFFLQDIG